MAQILIDRAAGPVDTGNNYQISQSGEIKRTSSEQDAIGDVEDAILRFGHHSAALPALFGGAGVASAAVCEKWAIGRFRDVREMPDGETREALYADFAPLVRRLMRQYGGSDPELRLDLAGEIYYRFCALLDAYDPERGVPLRPYLVRQLTASVYTYARQQWRSRKREVSLDAQMESGTGLAGLAGGCMGPHGRRGIVSAAGAASSGPCGPIMNVAADPTANWDDTIVQQQILKSLPQLIDNLPKRQRQVVIWRYYEQRSFEEIGSALDIQVSTARSLLRHGLTNLRKELAPIHCPTE